jgi:hypothetical protein
MAEPEYPADNQFAGLVEAATAAADQEGEWSQNEGADGYAHRVFGGDEGSELSRSSYGVHLRSGQYDPSLRSLRVGGESKSTSSMNIRKRKRASESNGGDERFAGQQAANRTAQQSSPQRTTAVVHAAAALFRAPSTSSKKYTRPPMSKLFSSLHLPPEDFLHLQSAAKAYMLADDHPERRDCVGQRGKTDSDMVKLKLWNCVQEFLDREGNGERFFGANVRKADGGDGAQAMTWPEHAEQIIKTCVPLLRRMVTNERQRQYAVETRKGGGEIKRDTHGQDAKQRENRAPRATVLEADCPETFTAETIDIFGDGMVAGRAEAPEWYELYNSDGALDKIFIKSGFPISLYLPLVTSIDGHCRLYHGNTGPQCGDTCRTRLVERLLEIPLYQESAPARDPWETVREIFNTVLSSLIRMRFWDNYSTEDTGMACAPGITVPQRTATTKRTGPRKEAASSSTAAVAGSNGQTPRSSQQLVINMVHQNRCLLPSFEILSSQCPNLGALRAQIQRHYSLPTLEEKGLSSLPEATLKVWLPDGLVTVKDDGQWMVALLSADAVEWMGGQIRVLLET